MTRCCARTSKQQQTFISVELICPLVLAYLYTYGNVPKTSSTFINGRKKEKAELKNENTDLFCQIEASDLKRRHMVPGIPKNYAMLFSQYVAMNMTVSIQSAKPATARRYTGSQVARVRHFYQYQPQIQQDSKAITLVLIARVFVLATNQSQNTFFSTLRKEVSQRMPSHRQKFNVKRFSPGVKSRQTMLSRMQRRSFWL